jgi:dihydrodipicolinate synthase/N-acetylneuraminate lyase
MRDAIARGATGVMGGAGHVKEDRAAWDALARDLEGSGSEAFAALLPLLNSEMQTVDTSIATHKWLLHEQGVIDSVRVRAPGPHLDAFQTRELQANLSRARSVLSGA